MTPASSLVPGDELAVDAGVRVLRGGEAPQEEPDGQPGGDSRPVSRAGSLAGVRASGGESPGDDPDESVRREEDQAGDEPDGVPRQEATDGGHAPIPQEVGGRVKHSAGLALCTFARARW